MVASLFMLVSKAMRKYIIRILFFFVIVAATDQTIGNVADYFQSHAKGGDTKMLNDFVLEDKYDIIILGSSRAHHHYVPQVISESIGLSCYNGGRDGNGILFQYGIYRMITERYHPCMIIYDIEPSFDIYEYTDDINNTRYLSALKPYFKNTYVAQTFKDVSVKEYIKVHSGLCRHNSSLISEIIDFFIPRGNGLVMDNGYVPLFGSINREPQVRPVKDDKADSLKIAYMYKFIKDASESKIPLLIVASPKYGATDSRHFDVIKDYCREFNIPFIDYYADSCFMHHKEWFKEPMHLNDEGARHFSKLITKYIKQYDKGFMDN